MQRVNELIRIAEKSEHGFLEIQKQAETLARDNTIGDSLSLSKKLFSSKVHQARCLATFILGFIASRSNEAVNILKKTVSKDEDWRVQEILAKAFDRYCSDAGYEKSLPVIEEWLKDGNPNVRRAVTEGLRIWTGREYFRDNPQVAIRLLSQLKNDESDYVRRSVGNALRDISKKHKDLIKSELETWDTSDNRIQQTYKLASKFINLKKQAR
jgi:3-methyladenine DNA glycosylase AlkC